MEKRCKIKEKGIKKILMKYKHDGARAEEYEDPEKLFEFWNTHYKDSKKKFLIFDESLHDELTEETV